MKNRFLFIIALFFSTAIFTGCEKDDPEIEKTATADMAGDWYVTYKVAGANGALEDVGGGYSRLNTYNTAANTSDQMWVTDDAHFWDFKVKANVDLGSKTFSATNATNAVEDYDIIVNIMDGKIIEKGGRSKTGVETDSIAFMIKFADDDDNLTYIVSGHRRTGFEEDEF